MPRPNRITYVGVLYHFIARFVASEWLIRDDGDRRQYLQMFGQSLMRSDWSCISYAVMSNHIHHALIAGKDSLASWLRNAHGEFAERINLRDERIGAVFVRGPKMYGVHVDGAASLVAYIHRNPVRAGLARRASESTWTSHRAYLNPEQAPEWLDIERGLELMRFDDATSMDAWIDATPVERKQLDAFRLEPKKRRGRPTKQQRPQVETSSAVPKAEADDYWIE